MNVESILTRMYSINFIDARTIVNEAKLSLNIDGYPNQEQKSIIIAQASDIFENKYSLSRQKLLQSRRRKLDFMKLESCGNSETGSVLEQSNGSDINSLSSPRPLQRRTKSRLNLFMR